MYVVNRVTKHKLCSLNWPTQNWRIFMCTTYVRVYVFILCCCSFNNFSGVPERITQMEAPNQQRQNMFVHCLILALTLLG